MSVYKVTINYQLGAKDTRPKKEERYVCAADFWTANLIINNFIKENKLLCLFCKIEEVDNAGE